MDKENCHPNKVTFENRISSASKKEEVEIVKSSAEEKTVVEKRRMSHPDDKLDVSSMKVVQLRKELRKRDLTTAGLKKDLQKRLQNHLDEARQMREEKNRDMEDKKAEKEEAERKTKEKEQVQRMARVKAQKEEEEKQKAIFEAEAKAKENAKAKAKAKAKAEAEAKVKAEAKRKEDEVRAMEQAEDNAKRAKEEIEAKAKEARAMEQAELEQIFQQQVDEFISQEDEICEMDIDDDAKNTSGSIANESNNQNGVQTDNVSYNENETDIEKMEIEATDQSDSQASKNVNSVDQSTFTSSVKSPRSPTKMVNNFGKKLFKATTKIFSPSKKKDNSPLKQRTDAATTRSDDEFIRGQGQRKYGSQVGVMPSSQTIRSDPGMSSQTATKSQKAQHVISFINKKESTGSISTLGASAASYSVKSTIPSYSTTSEPLSAQKILERKKALAEARRNRLAEIRGKVRINTVPCFFNFSQYCPNLLINENLAILKKYRRFLKVKIKIMHLEMMRLP